MREGVLLLHRGSSPSGMPASKRAFSMRTGEHSDHSSLSSRGSSSQHPQVFQLEGNVEIILFPARLLRSLPLRDGENEAQGHLGATKLGLCLNLPPAPRLLHSILCPHFSSVGADWCWTCFSQPRPWVNGLKQPGPSNFAGIGFLGSGNGTKMLHMPSARK